MSFYVRKVRLEKILSRDKYKKTSYRVTDKRGDIMLTVI